MRTTTKSPLERAGYIDIVTQCIQNVVLLPANIWGSVTHSCSQKTSSQTQLTHSMMIWSICSGLRVVVAERLQCKPTYTAANFDSTHYPSFHPSTLSMTAIAKENTVFGTVGAFVIHSLCDRFIRYVVLPELLQHVRPRSLGCVIHSGIGGKREEGGKGGKMVKHRGKRVEKRVGKRWKKGGKG